MRAGVEGQLEGKRRPLKVLSIAVTEIDVVATGRPSTLSG